MLYIAPYKQGSHGARELRRNIPGSRIIRHHNSRFDARRRRRPPLILNWGMNEFPLRFQNSRVINRPECVATATNKLSFLRALEQSVPHRCPRYWTDRDEVPENQPVLARRYLRASAGRGVHYSENREGLVDAPLYVQYIKKVSEFRLHVGRYDDYNLYFIQQKRRRHDTEDPDWRIRTHDNGFIFAVVNVDGIPDEVARDCFTVLDHLGLVFGAFDIIYNRYYDRYYILELNTAPGLEGSVMYSYADFFRRIKEVNND